MSTDSAAESNEFPPNAIAVIGMAGRLPGADSVSQFWDNLCLGRESVTTLSEEELTAAGVSATMTCTGKMKGTGSVQVSYSGTDHYTGSFRFQGTMEGQPANMNGTFKGDYLRADCGQVRPGR